MRDTHVELKRECGSFVQETFGRNLDAKLGRFEVVLRRAGVERQQNQRDFGRGGGDRTQDPNREQNIQGRQARLSSSVPQGASFPETAEENSSRR